MKKLIALLLALLMTTFVFAACDSAEEEESSFFEPISEVSSEPISEVSSEPVSEEESSQTEEVTSVSVEVSSKKPEASSKPVSEVSSKPVQETSSKPKPETSSDDMSPEETSNLTKEEIARCKDLLSQLKYRDIINWPGYYDFDQEDYYQGGTEYDFMVYRYVAIMPPMNFACDGMPKFDDETMLYYAIRHTKSFRCNDPNIITWRPPSGMSEEDHKVMLEIYKLTGLGTHNTFPKEHLQKTAEMMFNIDRELNFDFIDPQKGHSSKMNFNYHSDVGMVTEKPYYPNTPKYGDEMDLYFHSCVQVGEMEEWRFRVEASWLPKTGADVNGKPTSTEGIRAKFTDEAGVYDYQAANNYIRENLDHWVIELQLEAGYNMDPDADDTCEIFAIYPKEEA
ncbi:MAG: hypothetical protein J6A68_01240 [Oscillospiraceae bacterium]|nr:hypothetical protein [Oscillospiraceae bacterium]